jgi:peptidoglycan hydrolase FlgJ
MSEIGLNTILSTQATPSSTEQNPAKVRDAAKQFESLLIEQMLKSARESGSGDWNGTSEDQTGAPLSEMADQQFAQLLASNGGMGLAKLVVDGLERKH